MDTVDEDLEESNPLALGDFLVLSSNSPLRSLFPYRSFVEDDDGLLLLLRFFPNFFLAPISAWRCVAGIVFVANAFLYERVVSFGDT